MQVSTSNAMGTADGSHGRGSDFPSQGLSFKHLEVNQDRLMRAIHESCEYGKAHPWGQ